MKLRTHMNAFCGAVAALWALGLGGVAVTPVQAVDDYDAAMFDSPDQASKWVRWWGSAGQVYDFDDAMDAGGVAGSGSLKATIDFDLAAFAGDNQFAVHGDFADATLDGTKYAALSFMLRWGSASPKTAAGDYGYLEYGFRNSDWSQTWLGGATIAADAADKWVEIRVPITPALAKLESISGVVLKLWSGAAGGLSGSTVFWVDRVKLIGNTNNAPAPAPSIQLSSATPGLRLAASASGQANQRQNIRTLATDAAGDPRSMGWFGRAGPATYSFRVQEYPDAAHSGFQTHLLLVPEAGMPYGPGDSAIDWNAPQVVFVQVVNNADGSATGRFMYKTNLAGGNSMLWNADPAKGAVGSLGSITEPSPLGLWSVSFQDTSNVTLTGPSGVSTNLVMPAAAAALFTEPLYAYVGIQPNTEANIGQAALISEISITGVATPLIDYFQGDSLNLANWQVAAVDAPGVTFVPLSAKYWLSWDAPATGFTVQSAQQPGPGAWVDAGLSNVVQIGSRKTVVVPSANLPSTGVGFFKLAKP